MQLFYFAEPLGKMSSTPKPGVESGKIGGRCFTASVEATEGSSVSGEIRVWQSGNREDEV